MDPKRREKILMIVVVVLLAGAAIWFLPSLLGGAGASRTIRDQLAADVKEKNDLKEKAEAEARPLPDFQKRSLPSKLDVAVSLYQNWLLELADQVGLEDKTVEYNGKRDIHKECRKLTFAVRGQCSLERLARFVFAFEAADYLHQIRSLSIEPLDESKELRIVVTVEALALANAEQEDMLPVETEDALAEREIDGRLRPIIDRAFFTAYVPPPPDPGPAPPPPPPAPEPEPFDPSPHTYVSAIVEVDGEPEVWIHVRPSGKKHHLRVGERFELGVLECIVRRIEPRAVVLEVIGEEGSYGCFSIAFGAAFTDAQPTQL